MATGWIIKRNDKENGPFSAQQLKKLATSGKLKPEDLVRKQPGGKYQRANSIKGLFPEDSLEDADAGDTADFANIDISRFGDLPMEEEDDYGDEEDYGGGGKRRSKSATKSPPRAGGKGKKSGGGKSKGKSGKKNKVSWEDDPINDLFWGSAMICFAVGTLFFMDPATYELPDIVVTIHEYSGRFGVSVFLLLVSLIFFVPAYQKIQRIKDNGQKIPWHFPTLAWLVVGLFIGSEEDEE